MSGHRFRWVADEGYVDWEDEDGFPAGQVPQSLFLVYCPAEAAAMNADDHADMAEAGYTDPADFLDWEAVRVPCHGGEGGTTLGWVDCPICGVEIEVAR